MYGVLIFMAVVGCVYLALFLVMLVRVEIVISARDRAIDIISANNLDWSIYEELELNQMVWSLRKWTFEQFYPELANRGES